MGNSVDKINELIKDNQDCKFLCITEHWKSVEQLTNLSIKDFKLGASYCRKNKQHGGCAVYVHKNISLSPLNQIIKMSVKYEAEYAAVECSVNNNKFTIISVYRPPSGDINIFLSSIESILTSLRGINNKIIIAGDFNIHMLEQNSQKTDFLSLLQSFNLKQTIFENTRITHNSASCLDNIFVNFDYVNTKVIEPFISDHNAQKILFQLEQKSLNTFYSKRIFSDQNKDFFTNILMDQDWEEVYHVNSNNVDDQWKVFMNNFINIFNQCFPKKLININNTQKNKQKNDPRVKECKTRLNTYLTLSRNNNIYKEQYKKIKKEYDHLLQTIRSEAYEQKIKTSENKNKCMWNICTEITGQKNKNPDIGIRGDPEKIPDQFNEYLLSIIPELLKELKTIPFSHNIKQNDQSMFLKPLSSSQVCEFGKKIKNKHSSGVDDIPTSIVKFAIPLIKNVLCYIINNAFKYGIFPNQLKVALIKPLYKKDNIEEMENYRPISLLPAFSKLFELAMCQQLTDFFHKCNLFNTIQHGYMAGKSTLTAIFKFVTHISESIEKGNLTIGMCLDLSKAYDCINPTLLLKKLELYGVRGNAYNLFQSYLTNRQQKVQITKNGKTYFSNLMENKTGIAQGSIAGPILFVVFLNDLNSIATCPNEYLTCYADDTNIIVGEKNMPQLLTASENLFNKANIWFVQNQLILNAKKTNILLFRTKLSNINKPDQVSFGDTDLETVETTKFLGVHLDEFLNWSPHINNLLNKLNSVCYGMRVVGKYINEKCLKIIYFANFESRLKYGIMFWGCNSLIEKVFVIQKRVLRILKNMYFNESCRGVFRACGILTVYGIYIYECLLFFFKNRNMFELKTFHKYNTRTLNVNYPIHRLTLTEKMPSYVCLKFFNSLPHEIKSVNSLNVFKTKVKKMLLNLEPYSIKDFIC